MEDTFTALASRKRQVNGVPMSLVDLGYNDAGLDDNWQNCGGYGPNNYTYHNASGYPVVATDRFPDMLAMTTYAHSLNITVGWYHNNCECHDHCNDPMCFVGDVESLFDYGYDSVKLDGCGQEENIELWYDLLAQALINRGGKTNGGKEGILVENCHNGGGSKNQPSPNGWCPFNYYRSSTDIRPVFGSILANLQSVPPLVQQNLSYPGCWAYPDMLEVGVTNTQSDVPPLNHSESRAHFSAWCIVSAPLILGLNVTDDPTVDSVWDIITNQEAIAINQDYAGNSGTLFYQNDTLTPFAPCGWWLPNCSFPIALYFYKPLSNGDTAILLMNNAPVATTLSVNWSQVPGLQATGTYKVRDLWLHQDMGSFSNSYTCTNIPSHDVCFLRLSTN